MGKYIHRRNIRFKNQLADLDKSKLLGVAIDPSKNFHRVIIFDFRGKLYGQSFSIDTLRKGFEELIKRINRYKERIKAHDVFIAIEAGGSYTENLFNHLQTQFKNVISITPLDVANNRLQKSLHGLKTDDVDCGAIGDLLIRGEFFPPYVESQIYYKLRNLAYWRDKKVVMRSVLKNQIADRFNKIYPGINSSFGDYKKLYSDPHEDFLFHGLLNNGLSGQEILRTSDEKLFKLFGYGLHTCGKRRIKALKVRLKEMLLPEENTAKIQIDIMRRDIELLRTVETVVNQIDEEIVRLGKLTPAKYLMGQIKGINDVNVSMYVGLVGNFSRYRSAKQIYSKAGLSPRIIHSGGSKPSSMGIKRVGNYLLRSLLFQMASTAIICEPYFMNYNKRMKEEKDRHWKKNRIAICRKINNLLFALVRDKSAYKRMPLEARHEMKV